MTSRLSCGLTGRVVSTGSPLTRPSLSLRQCLPVADLMILQVLALVWPLLEQVMAGQVQRIVGTIDHRSKISGCSEVEATRCDAIFHLLGTIRGHPLQRGIEAHVPTAIGDVWAFQRAGPWPVDDRECCCQVNGSPRDNPIIVQATTAAAGAIRQRAEDLDRLTRRLRCSMAPLPPQWRHHMLTSTDFISVG